jgi:hypothetical protein
VRLEQFLVLNRYLNSRLGARSLGDLKSGLQRIQEGRAGDGQSYFYGALVGQVRDADLREKLRDYDSRVMGYEARLAKARGSFSFKYFQYLCLLYAEIYLDRVTEDPQQFVLDLNSYLGHAREQETGVREVPSFTPEDLRRLAFFMATGSGKTLLLHVNLWQIIHYLERGRHPEALVRRADKRRQFDTVLLITPNEGLSQQHLQEFQRSGINAALLVQDRSGNGLFGPTVKIIEIHKLAEEPSKEGVSILLDELGSINLVCVDEGHKGTGSEAQTWKTRQKRLSADGFLLEYSATFAQSIGAASRKAQKDLLGEYGKSILFDYSYRHFYDDGYGKDFQVLNLAQAREDQAFDLLLGGLLTYYQQLRLFHQHRAAYGPYNLEKPLWIFLGSSVNAIYSREGHKRSDVATVVAFLKQFLEQPAWAIEGITGMLKGQSGFVDQESGQDLFTRHLLSFKEMDPRDLYGQIARAVFQGSGGLEVWDLKRADGELGLRVSSAGGEQSPYFGVINIGDISAFKKHLAETLGIETREDRFSASLFGEINRSDSPVHLLAGSKKFIEGWSSWRVSSMGLLNMGKGEGPQVIQLFGRGVRLKGKKWTLKRSAALPEEGPHPDGLGDLEKLFIFGWNADYIQAFRKMLEQEDMGYEFRVPVRIQYELWSDLPVPKPKAGYKAESETWSLDPQSLKVDLDLTPKVTFMEGASVGAAEAGKAHRIDFNNPAVADLLDMDALYADLVEYKADRGYENVHVPRKELRPILQGNELYLSAKDAANPSLIQEGASRLLRTYLDRFVAAKEREAEGQHLEPATLAAVHESVVSHYIVRVSAGELLKELTDLLKKPQELYSDGAKPLPRLHIDRHLFTPLLLRPEDFKLDGISIHPPGLGREEAEFLGDLRDFWKTHHDAEEYLSREVYVLRNLPRVGVGFFRRSGFYPDFILWVKDGKSKRTHIQFIDPHGLHHGGLSGNRERIEALKELSEVSQEAAFRKKKLTMGGYLLTRTKLDQIPGAEHLGWQELEQDYQILRQEGIYLKKVLAVGLKHKTTPQAKS